MGNRRNAKRRVDTLRQDLDEAGIRAMLAHEKATRENYYRPSALISTAFWNPKEYDEAETKRKAFTSKTFEDGQIFHLESEMGEKRGNPKLGAWIILIVGLLTLAMYATGFIWAFYG